MGGAEVVSRVGEIGDIDSSCTERPGKRGSHQALRPAAEDGDSLAGDIGFSDGVDRITQGIEEGAKSRRNHGATAEPVQVDDVVAWNSHVFGECAVEVQSL